MILFYVCTRCNHNFQDKLGEGQTTEITEDVQAES
jgi:hypothetical protein